MSTIDVLWFEDEPNQDFIKLAKDEDFNINLILMDSACTAIDYINSNIEHLDGAILDARGHFVPNDDPKETGMYQIKDLLKSYSRERPIPVAIITGQKDLLKKEGFEETLNTKLFRKNRDEEEVLQYIRDKANELDDVKIKTKNPLVFEIFDEDIVKKIVKDSKIQELKGNLVKQLKGPIDITITPRIIRGFFQGLIFPIMEHYEIIPSWCKKFNEKARQLSFKKYGYSEDLERLYRAIALSTQEPNHDEPEVKIVNYLQDRKDTYYVDCLFKGLLSILTWLPVFIKSRQ